MVNTEYSPTTLCVTGAYLITNWLLNLTLTNWYAPYVSYTLFLVVMTGLIILWVYVINIWVLTRTHRNDGLSCLMFGLKLWLSVTICHVEIFMLNLPCSIPIFYVSNILFSLVDSTQLVQSYDSHKLFFSGNFSELSIIPYSLLLLITKTMLLFPSPPIERWWKMPPTIFRRIWLVMPRPHV